MAQRNESRTKQLSVVHDESPSALRSRTMRAVRSRNTSPELAVRKMLRGLGFTGYRLHRKELPGKPDVVFLGRRKAIFIHGCFWHGHNCPHGRREPSTNAGYWLPKIERNRQRDAEHLVDLAELRWSVLTVWECELRSPVDLAERLRQFLTDGAT